MEIPRGIAPSVRRHLARGHQHPSEKDDSQRAGRERVAGSLDAEGNQEETHRDEGKEVAGDAVLGRGRPSVLGMTLSPGLRVFLARKMLIARKCGLARERGCRRARARRLRSSRWRRVHPRSGGIAPGTAPTKRAQCELVQRRIGEDVAQVGENREERGRRIDADGEDGTAATDRPTPTSARCGEQGVPPGSGRSLVRSMWRSMSRSRYMLSAWAPATMRLVPMMVSIATSGPRPTVQPIAAAVVMTTSRVMRGLATGEHIGECNAAEGYERRRRREGSS